MDKEHHVWSGEKNRCYSVFAYPFSAPSLSLTVFLMPSFDELMRDQMMRSMGYQPRAPKAISPPLRDVGQPHADREAPALSQKVEVWKSRCARERASAANPAKLFLRHNSSGLGEVLTARRAQAILPNAPKASAEARNARRRVESLGATRLIQALNIRVKEQQLGAKAVSALQQYTLCMQHHGYAIPPPVTEKNASLYLTWYVLVKDNASHALGQVLSCLRNAAKATGIWQVSVTGEASISAVIKTLQRAKPTAQKARLYVPTARVLATCTRLRTIGTLHALQRRAIISIGVGTHARGEEMAGKEAGMRFGDFKSDHRGIGFSTRLSKMNKLSLVAQPRAFPHLPLAMADMCPARCLNDYRVALEHSGLVVSNSTYLWVELPMEGTLFTPGASPRALTVKETIVMAREELVRDGITAKAIDAHWARYVGAALLTFEFKLDKDVAESLGDWAPSCNRGVKGVRETVYIAPARCSVDWLMDTAHKHSASAGVPLCCQFRTSGRANAGSRKRSRDEEGGSR